jgi:hypothetical protein
MNTTAKTLSALLLGAALATPALAQDNASTNNSAQATAPGSAPAAAPTTPVDTSANTQLAMNTTGNASDLSSVPDTQKKYSRATRSRDFKSEAQTTRELNQKEAGMSGGSAQ